jgi:hypothetical protein
LTRDRIEHDIDVAASWQPAAKRHNSMKGDLKFQLRLTLSDEFAQGARNDPTVCVAIHRAVALLLLPAPGRA